MHTNVYPFAAIIGQEKLKQALILNAVNPAIGGVLIRGEKGTAKSTAVRALAALLPEIRVVVGCPFACDPEEPQDLCEQCRAGDGRPASVSRRLKVVTLPLNATEDRVAGGIDFSLAVKTGRRVFQPGLLALAHRGILYIDEVNLLDDHLVDIILDAAGSGRNVVEREGMSFSHASRFILVGTMNPEEGELRPQLLDRFGLCVEVSSEPNPDQRITLMQQREAYDAAPREFLRRYDRDNERLGRQIAAAGVLLPEVVFPAPLRRLVSDVCLENNVAGHRADLVIEQAARALAAFREQREVTLAEVQEVAALALVHRRREPAPPPPPPPPPEPDHDHDHQHEHDEQQSEPEEQTETPEPPEPQEAAPGESDMEMSPPESGEEMESSPPEADQDDRDNVREQIFEVGETFQVKKFASPRDRVCRRGSGRRSRTRVAQKQGRYVKSALGGKTGDVALDATLRAAAPHQVRRKKGHDLAVILRPEDLRDKIREKRIGNFLLFLVDASGSMGARGRMTASKGAIMSLLLDAYQKRDRIAMISFRKQEAVVNLPPTSSVELAAGLLREMPVGGRTPLSAGLAKSYEVLRNYLLRQPTARPLVIVITDGKSNVALGERQAVAEALDLAARLCLDDRIQFIVVDTESQGLVNFGLARKLAVALQAQYFKIEELKADTLVNIAKGKVQ